MRQAAWITSAIIALLVAGCASVPHDAGVSEVVVPDLHLGRGARRRDALDALRVAVAATLPGAPG